MLNYNRSAELYIANAVVRRIAQKFLSQIFKIQNYGWFLSNYAKKQQEFDGKSRHKWKLETLRARV